ncbi:MAG: hypothetical protein ACKVU4_05620 [Phycisphaerales bacterium]
MARFIRNTLLTLGLIGAIIAGAALWHTRERLSWFYTDADTIRRATADAPARDVLWQPAARLPDLSGEGEEYEPRLSEDGLTLFFVRGKAGGGADIWTAARTRRADEQGWTDPQPLSAVNSSTDDLGPEPSADGSSLYFYSDRPGGLGGYDLWVSRRGPDGWEQPTNLGAAVNSPSNDYGPALTPDGGTLYFASNRLRPGEPAPNQDRWPATVRELHQARDYDLYASAITGREPDDAARLDALSTANNEGSPAVSPFGDFLYFSSDRAGGLGGFDLWRSRRLRGAHEPAENLGDAVNSAANDLDPAPGLGGFSLTFSSNRPREAAGRPREAVSEVEPDAPTPEPLAESGEPAAPHDYDLYRSYSREVFREHETTRATIDWAWLLPRLWWLLLAATLALIAWLLWKARRSDRLGKLSLIAKCLLASALIHALILLCSAFWYVGNSLDGWFRPAGGTRIAIERAAGGGDIASQIRGALTELAVEPMAQTETVRLASFSEETPPQAAGVEFDVAQARPTIEVDRQTAAGSDAPTPDAPEVGVREADLPRDDPAEVQTPAPAPRAVARESAVALSAESLTSPESQRAASPETTTSRARTAALTPEDSPAPSHTDSIAEAAAVSDAQNTPAPAAAIAAGPESELNDDLALAAPAAGARLARSEAAPSVSTASAESAPTRPEGLSDRPPSAASAAIAPAASAARPGPSLAAADPTSVREAAPVGMSAAPASNAAALASPAPSNFATPAAPRGSATGEAAPSAGLARSAALQAPTAAEPASGPGAPARVDTPRAHAAASSTLASAPSAADTAPALGELDSEPTRQATALGAQTATTPLATPAAPHGSSTAEPAPSAGLARSTAAQAPTTAEGAPAPGAAARVDAPRSQAASSSTLAAAPAPDDAAPARGGLSPAPPTSTSALTAPASTSPMATPAAPRGTASNEPAPSAGLARSAALQAPTAAEIAPASGASARVDAPRSQSAPSSTLAAEPTATDSTPAAGGRHIAPATNATALAAPATTVVAMPDTDRPAAGRTPEPEADRLVGLARAPGPRAPSPTQSTPVSGSPARVAAPRTEAAASSTLAAEPIAADAAPGLASLSSTTGVRPELDALGPPDVALGLPRSASSTPREISRDSATPGLSLASSESRALSRDDAAPARPAAALLTPDAMNATARSALRPIDAGALPARDADPRRPDAPGVALGGSPIQPLADAIALRTPGETEPPAAAVRSPSGTLSGLVLDAVTNEPLGDATVRLDLPEGGSQVVQTGPDGVYTITAAALPDHVAVSASRDGYTPDSADFAATDLGLGLRHDFRLTPTDRGVIALEDDPQVHHLGDDDFEGRINSQFQKPSEGLLYENTIRLGADQIPPRVVRAEIVMLAKGTQGANEIRINGRLVDERLTGSPRDGSFGVFRVRFPAEWLVTGENTVTIRSVRGAVDYDDFEFVNVRVRTARRSARPAL